MSWSEFAHVWLACGLRSSGIPLPFPPLPSSPYSRAPRSTRRAQSSIWSFGLTTSARIGGVRHCGCACCGVPPASVPPACEGRDTSAAGSSSPSDAVFPCKVCIIEFHCLCDMNQLQLHFHAALGRRSCAISWRHCFFVLQLSINDKIGGCSANRSTFLSTTDRVGWGGGGGSRSSSSHGSS